jgi:hypothetical protein
VNKTTIYGKIMKYVLVFRTSTVGKYQDADLLQNTKEKLLP